MRRFVPTLTFLSSLFLIAGAVGCSSSASPKPDAGSGGGGGSPSGSGGSGGSGTGGGSGGSATGGSGGGSGGSGGTTDAGSDRPAADSGGDAPRDTATGETAGEAGGADGGTLTFTSTGLRMMGAGLVFPAAASAPTNQSPAFMWSGAPAGTMSFAISLHDLSANGTHWIIWDIPASVSMLPAGLPRIRMLTTPVTAQQKAIYGDTNGYEGPGGTTTNNYEFELWALNVATLPAAVAGQSTAMMRTTGLNQYKIASVKIMARGTRGGL